jgi:hypothetical protein
LLFCWDSVKYLGDDGVEATELAHLVGILSFTSNSGNDETLFLMICWMQIKKLPKKDNHFPYPYYCYNIKKNKELYIDIVPIESLIRPAFLINYSPNYYYYWNEVNKIRYKDLESMIFCRYHINVLSEMCVRILQSLYQAKQSIRIYSMIQTCS